MPPGCFLQAQNRTGSAEGVVGELALPGLVFGGPTEAVGLQGGAKFGIRDGIKYDLQPILCRIADNLAGSVGGGGVKMVVFCQAFPGALQLAAQGGQFVIRAGRLGKGTGDPDLTALFFCTYSCSFDYGYERVYSHSFTHTRTRAHTPALAHASVKREKGTVRARAHIYGSGEPKICLVMKNF